MIDMFTRVFVNQCDQCFVRWRRTVLLSQCELGGVAEQCELGGVVVLRSWRNVFNRLPRWRRTMLLSQR
jgi:hypothetical protein